MMTIFFLYRCEKTRRSVYLKINVVEKTQRSSVCVDTNEEPTCEQFSQNID
jgi:hypothetical protein